MKGKIMRYQHFDERRFKRFAMEPGEIIWALMGPTHEFHRIRVDETLPTDTTVVNVDYDQAYRSFTVCLHSTAFPIVADGEYIPTVQPVGFETLHLRQGSDGKWGVAEESDELTQLRDLADTAWSIIANAYGGDWDAASEASGWKAAAIRWRDRYHGGSPGNAKGVIDEVVNTNPLTPELTCGDCNENDGGRVWTCAREDRVVEPISIACVKIVLSEEKP